jgi:hypothetical protein
LLLLLLLLRLLSLLCAMLLLLFHAITYITKNYNNARIWVAVTAK